MSDNIDGVPYKLFSALPLNEHICVADYMELAKKAYDEIVAMGKTPIFVGGTGYYINVLLNGISSIPEISEEVRKRARDMVQQDIDSVRKMLPNDFMPTDPQRVARALEVFLETGKSLSDWQKQPRKGKVVYQKNQIVFLSVFVVKYVQTKDGAKNIIEKGLDETRAIGATQLCKMLRGELSEKDAIENWIVKTNQYAKRQRTWFRGQYDADFIIDHTPNDDDINQVINQIS